jgi:hypothetical protein
MDEQRVVHPDIVPDAGLAPAQETQRLDLGRAGVAEFPDRDRKPVARINDHSAAEATGAY